MSAAGKASHRPRTTEAQRAAPPGASHGRQPTLLDVAARRTRDLAQLLPRRASGFSPDDVHDLRVATRRLGEVVKLLTPLMENATADAAGGALRDLRKAAGDLRDLDVLAEHLQHARMARPLRAIAEAILGTLPTRRPRLEAHLAETCGAATVSGAMLVVSRVIEEHAAPARRSGALKKLDAALQKRIASRRKGVARAFGRAARRQTAASLHEARIAIKRLRYVLELADDSHAGRKGPARKELHALKAMQKLLGDHHDTHVIMETLESHLPPGTAPAALRTAWTRATKSAAQLQARRAADFFMHSYLWRNPA